MSTQPYEVIVSGHLCLDLIPEVTNVMADEITMPGHLLEVGPLAISTGGVVSNTGLALHRLGVKVGLMATVGDDFLGQSIIAFLNRRAPDLAHLVAIQPASASSYSIVLSPEHHDRTFLHCIGTNAIFGYAHIDFAQVRQTQIFHLGYPPFLPRLIANDGEELVAIYRAVKTQGVVTSLDMALPDPRGSSGQVNWHTILGHALPFVDIFIPSLEEAVFMLRRADFDAWQGDFFAHLTYAYLCDLAAEMVELGAVIVGFKLGEFGFFLHTAGADRFARLKSLSLDVTAWATTTLWTPAFQVEVVGTTGAGDAAYAGFLAALLRGLNPAACARFACAVGACNVEAADATGGVRSWEETQARLAAGWSYRPERLPDYLFDSITGD